MDINEKIVKLQIRTEIVSAASVLVVIVSYILGHVTYANDISEKLVHLLMTITFSSISIFGIGMIVGFELVNKILKDDLFESELKEDDVNE